MTRPSNTQAIESSTGISWQEWTEYLGDYRELDHKAMAKKAFEKLSAASSVSNPGWWAQNVTVAYEQHIGRRTPGQLKDGSFSVSVTKTIDSDMDTAMELWQKLVDGLDDSGGQVISEVEVSKTEKWRYWRANMSDGTRLIVSTQNKPSGGKSILSITQSKLSDAKNVEKRRTYWKRILSENLG